MDAAHEWQRRLRRRERCEAPALEGDFWSSLADATVAVAAFDEPRALGCLARAGLAGPPDTASRAAYEETLGAVHFGLDDYGQAQACFERARVHWDEAEEPLCVAEVQAWLGASLVQQGRYGQGLAHLQAALEAFERLGCAPRGARALLFLGIVYDELGDRPRAAEVLERAAKAAEADADAEVQGRVLARQGEAAVALRGVDRGLSLLERAVTVFRAVGGHSSEASTLVAIGRVHQSRHDAKAAAQTFEAALAAAERGHAPLARATVYAALGEYHSKEGRHAKARQWLSRALELSQAVGIRREVFKTHKLLADAFKRAGDFEAALRHHEVFHDLRSEVYDAVARERVEAVKAEFELERIREAQVKERRLAHDLAIAYAELEVRAHALAQLSLRDALTGLFNRRHFDEALPLEVTRAGALGQQLSLALIDVDYFKRVNDEYSHLVGDEVLRTVAKLVQGELRDADVVARYGGEELAVILPHTSLDGARVAAEKLRNAIASYDWSLMTPSRRITVSIGVAQALPGEAGLSLVHRADQALYQAKADGRNRVVVAAEGPVHVEVARGGERRPV